MAQFDVHRNCGQNRDSIPYVVDKRRVVVPLVKKSYLDKVSHPRFKKRLLSCIRWKRPRLPKTSWGSL